MTEVKLTLAQKLVRVYEEVDHVTKRGTNSAQNYKYVKAGDLAHAVRNALLKLNVYAQVTFTTIRVWSFITSSGKSQNAYDVQCDIEFFDADAQPGGPTFRTTGIGSGADFGDKGVFKAQTGGLKYALRNAFLVPDDTDPENDENEKPEKTKSTSAIVSSTSPVHPTSQGTNSATSSEPLKPERAAIPTSLSPESQPAASPATDINDIPTDAELKPFRAQHIALVKRLSENGLTGETGNPQKRKVTRYLLSVVGADSVENVTKGQWRTFFAMADGADVKQLVQLVEAAGK